MEKINLILDLFKEETLETVMFKGDFLFNARQIRKILGDSNNENLINIIDSKKIIKLKNSHFNDNSFRKINKKGEEFINSYGTIDLIFLSTSKKAIKMQETLKKAGITSKISNQQQKSIFENNKQEILNYGFEIVDGKLIVRSKILSKNLKRSFSYLTKQIKNIISSLLKNRNVEEYFIRDNFKGKNGQEYLEYLLTKDGFVLYMFAINSQDPINIEYLFQFKEKELKSTPESSENQDNDLKNSLLQIIFPNLDENRISSFIYENENKKNENNKKILDVVKKWEF